MLPRIYYLLLSRAVNGYFGKTGQGENAQDGGTRLTNEPPGQDLTSCGQKTCSSLSQLATGSNSKKVPDFGLIVSSSLTKLLNFCLSALKPASAHAEKPPSFGIGPPSFGLDTTKVSTTPLATEKPTTRRTARKTAVSRGVRLKVRL